jgi:hypothetical protein
MRHKVTSIFSWQIAWKASAVAGCPIEVVFLTTQTKHLQQTEA